MISDFVFARLHEVLYSIVGLFGCVCLLLFGGDALYFTLALFKIVPWDPKFNPLRSIPFERRVQAIGLSLAGGLIPITTTFTAFCILNIKSTWWWFLPYATYCIYNDEHLRGGRRSEWFRKRFIQRIAAQYFPTKVHKWHEDTKFPVDKSYLFGYHPHGIFSFGVITSFGSDGSDISHVLPGLEIAPCTLNSNFQIPFLKDWALALGFIGVGRESLDYVLKQGKGKGAMIVVGGAEESLHTEPNSHKLVLLKRKGFFRVALSHGSNLVPVYGFGENNIYEIAEQTGWQARLSNFTRRYFRFSLPAFQGRGIFQTKYGLIPQRHPLNVVIGDPIECPKIENPTEEQIAEIQKKYCDALVKLFDEMKVKYVADPKKEKLDFVH